MKNLIESIKISTSLSNLKKLSNCPAVFNRLNGNEDGPVLHFENALLEI